MSAADRAPSLGTAPASRLAVAALALGAVAFTFPFLEVFWNISLVGPLQFPWVALPLSWTAVVVGVTAIITTARGGRRGMWMSVLGTILGLAFPILVSIAP